MDDFKFPLNEIFFGKQPGLLMVEELFDKFKIQYKKANPMGSSRDYREMIKDPILKKIGEKLASVFGFKDVVITLVRENTVNAYTISFFSDYRGYSYDMNNKKFTNDELRNAVIVTNDGFRFNNRKFKTGLLVCLNLGILFKTKLSTPELVAVLLHEIGHNFSKVVIDPKKVSGRVDEKFADQFVAMYGYGPELITAFQKMTINYGEIEKVFRHVPVLNVVMGAEHILSDMMTNALLPPDPHPAMRNRMESQIKQLESDLKNTPNLTPEMKKIIEGQIKACRDAIDGYFDNNDDMTDRMMKYYYGTMEPNGWSETNANKTADQYSGPDKINDQINKMYHKKGFFKI